jgi:hypothetical protein
VPANAAGIRDAHSASDASLTRWSVSLRRITILAQFKSIAAIRRQRFKPRFKIAAPVRRSQASDIALALPIIRFTEEIQMLLRLARKVEWKSQQRLEQWYADRHAETDSLIRAFHESSIVHGSEGNPAEKVQRLEVLFAARGGRDQ